MKSKNYKGKFTKLAEENFKISGITAPKIFIKAIGLVKLASATTNAKLKLLNPKQISAIKKATKEFIAGDYNNQFQIDIFQAGAGTSYNMNANEIIANRANEILQNAGIIDKDTILHPNQHINMAQSTNDVIPTSTKISALLALPKLLTSIENLENELQEKAKQYKNTIKVGRTHLQDAVPITFGQTFNGYKEAIHKSYKFIQRESENLKTLHIGGTAVGTGINTDPKYHKTILEELSKLTGIKLKSAKNFTEGNNNINDFMNFSSATKSLATNLLNLSGDLKLMNMGPKAGIRELELPESQPGSSIMPGKVNPSIVESVEMVCLQVIGNDTTISIASQKSQFELNVFVPIVMYNLLQSMEILTNALNTLVSKCLIGAKVNEKTVKNTFKKSLTLATALAPYIGYDKTAQIVKDALKNNHTLIEEIKIKKLLPAKKLKEILSIQRTTKPAKKLK